MHNKAEHNGCRMSDAGVEEYVRACACVNAIHECSLGVRAGGCDGDIVDLINRPDRHPVAEGPVACALDAVVHFTRRRVVVL